VAGAKETILWRVRRATRDVPEGERLEDVAVERGYRKEGGGGREEVVARFAEHVAEYEATVHRVAEADLPVRIGEILEKRGLKTLVVPPLLPEAWIPEGVETLRDAARPRLTNEELDGADGVLTGCALGIAQTGTNVLDGPASSTMVPVWLMPSAHPVSTPSAPSSSSFVRRGRAASRKTFTPSGIHASGKSGGTTSLLRPRLSSISAMRAGMSASSTRCTVASYSATFSAKRATISSRGASSSPR